MPSRLRTPKSCRLSLPHIAQHYPTRARRPARGVSSSPRRLRKSAAAGHDFIGISPRDALQGLITAWAIAGVSSLPYENHHQHQGKGVPRSWWLVPYTRPASTSECTFPHFRGMQIKGLRSRLHNEATVDGTAHNSELDDLLAHGIRMGTTSSKRRISVRRVTQRR